MPVSVTSTPLYPTVKKGARLSFVPTTGNFVRVWCTDAPLGSKLRTQLDEQQATRLPIHEGDIATAPATGEAFAFQPDAPGKYVIAIQEYTRGASSFGGGYAGDPLGFGSETKVGSEVSTTIDFGERLAMQIGTGADTGELALWVWDDTIRATTLALHDELTPAITKPSSQVAKTAIAAVRSQLLALVNVAATTAMGDTTAIMVDMYTKFAGHFGNAIHANPDTANIPNTSLILAGSKTGIPKTATELLTALTLHINTDNARTIPFVSSGIGTGDWHNVLLALADSINAVRAPLPTTMEQAYVGLADAWTSYEHHRKSINVHSGQDLTYLLLTPPKLLALHIAFLDVVRSSSPTANPTENPGAVALIHGAGMKGS
jgi:hypothetical protein